MTNNEGEFNEKEAVGFVLSEIPRGYLRLTHFTTEEVAKKFTEQKQGFSYRKSVIITKTTDQFRNNQEILQLIKTKKYGGQYERGRYGSAIVLMDVEIKEYKKRANLNFQEEKSEIPNHNILGYVLTEEKELDLYRNPNYDPKENSLTPIPPGPYFSPDAKRDIPIVDDLEEIESEKIW